MSVLALLIASLGTQAPPLPPAPGQFSGNLLRSPGYVEIASDASRHQGFPGLCISNTSTKELMVAYRNGNGHGVDGFAYVDARWSSDRGHTWSAPTTIYNPDPSNGDPRDVTLNRLSDGRIVMTCYHYATDYKAQVLFSSDNGRTFGSPIQVNPSLLSGSNAVTGPVIEAPNGDLLVATYGPDPSHATLNSAVCSRSTDGGATWGSTVMIASGPSTVGDALGSESEGHFFEPYLIKLADDTLYCGLRHSREKFWWAKSVDSGATWTDLTKASFVGYGRPALAQIASTGALVMVNRNNPLAFYRTSHDNGVTWAAQVTLDSGSMMAYSQMVEIRPGELATVWCMEHTSPTPDALRFTYLYDSELPDPFL